jgi:hypothetical protein
MIKFKSDFTQGKRLAYNARELVTKKRAKGVEAVQIYTHTFIFNAKEFCPKRTGRLANSIGNPAAEGILELSPGGLSVTIGTSVPYAQPVETGVGSYIIRAKYKRLKFRDTSGKYVYPQQVIHPAKEGKWYMLRAHIEAEKAVNVFMSVS